MTELVQIRITGLISTARYGNLSTGDLLRTDAAFAQHLVEDCAAAEYVNQTAAPAEDATQPELAAQGKRRRSKKEN